MKLKCDGCSLVASEAQGHVPGQQHVSCCAGTWREVAEVTAFPHPAGCTCGQCSKPTPAHCSRCADHKGWIDHLERLLHMRQEALSLCQKKLERAEAELRMRCLP